MSDPNFMPDKCTIKTDGNLECFSGTTSLGTLKVSMKGTKPTSGTIYIDEDDITYENIVLNAKKYYEKESYATLVNDAAPTGISIGDKYTYKVNATDTFNFYVLKVEGDKVHLIMDRNICEDGTVATESNKCTVAWHAGEDNNNYGPDTAMTYLYNGTKNWINVPDMIMNYIDENNQDSETLGYTIIITSNGVTTITGKNGATSTTIGTTSLTLKARLSMMSEVTDIGCKIENNDSCPAWLVQYMHGTQMSGIWGYWILPSSDGSALRIRPEGYLSSDSVSYDGGNGVRPVITVSKSDL